MVVPPLFQRVPQRGKGPGLRSLLARYRPRLSIISRKTFWKTQARRYHSTGGRPRTGSDFTIGDRKTVGAPHKPLDHALPLGETSCGMLSASSSARKSMQIGPTTILDTFAEAFRMRYARLVVTADDDYWLDAALRALSGYGTSVIG